MASLCCPLSTGYFHRGTYIPAFASRNMDFNFHSSLWDAVNGNNGSKIHELLGDSFTYPTPSKSTLNTMLTKAARDGHQASVSALIQNGSDPNFREWNMGPPLLYAIESGHYNVAKYLIENGSNVNLPQLNDRQWTPMHVTAFKGNHAMLTLINSAGAKWDMKDLNRNCPCLFAASNVNTEVLQQFVKWDPTCVNSVNEKGQTMLHLTTKSDKLIDNTHLLVVAGANVNTKDYSGATPLEFALLNKSYKISQLLLLAGSDPTGAKLQEVLTQNGDHQQFDWMKTMAYNPRSMKQLSRITFGKFLGTKIHRVLPQLDYPPALRQYLSYADFQ